MLVRVPDPLSVSSQMLPCNPTQRFVVAYEPDNCIEFSTRRTPRWTECLALAKPVRESADLTASWSPVSRCRRINYSAGALLPEWITIGMATLVPGNSG